MSPLGTLAPLGMAAGAAAMWLFRRTTDGPVMRATVNRIEARLLEFWLFVDEPAAIWKSWRGLLGANARLLRLLLLPVAILTTLPVGQPALVTLQFDRPLEQLASLPELRAPAAISVESPPVRVFSRRQVSWRIRPLRRFSGYLQWVVDGRRLAKPVTAGTTGPGFPWAPRWRTSSPGGPIDWIEISYPTDAHWSIWFLAFSLIGALIAHYFRKAAAMRSRH
jgi:hypothetical protein